VAKRKKAERILEAMEEQSAVDAQREERRRRLAAKYGDTVLTRGEDDAVAEK